MIGEVSSGSVDTTRAQALEVDLETMLNDNSSAGSAVPDASVADETPEPTPSGWNIDFKPLPGMFKSCNDPLLMFRELRTLGELDICVDGVEALDFDTLDPEVCQLAWQLRLNASVSREQVEEVFAWVTDECELVLEPIEADASPAVTPAPAPAPAKAQAADDVPAKAKASTQEAGSIRVNIDKVDALINLVGELVITQSMLGRFQGEFDFTEIEALREGLSQLSRNTRDIQESVMSIRMLPMSFAFSRFPRLVRDTGNALGKKVELRLTGEAT